MAMFRRSGAWVVLACLAVSPAWARAQDPAEKAVEERTEKEEAEAKRSMLGRYLKGISLTEEQSKEIEAIHAQYHPQIVRQEKILDEIVSPAKRREAAVKIQEARERGVKGDALEELRYKLYGLTAEKAEHFRSVLTAISAIWDEARRRGLEVLDDKQREIFNQNLAELRGNR